MKEIGSCLMVLLAGLVYCAYLAGIVCLGLSMIWLLSDIYADIAIAYWGLGLAVGGKTAFKALTAIIKEM